MTAEAAKGFGNVVLPSTGGEGNHAALMGKTFKIPESSDQSPKKTFPVEAWDGKIKPKMFDTANLRL